MQITATNFRKDLFQVIDRASQGEEVLITHKGKQYRLTPEKPLSKLDRITPMEGFDLEEPDEAWEEAKSKMQAEWEIKWERRLGSDRLP